MFFWWGLNLKVRTLFSLVLLSPNSCHLIHLDSNVDGWCIHGNYFPIGAFVALVEILTIWFTTTLTIDKVSPLDFHVFSICLLYIFNFVLYMCPWTSPNWIMSFHALSWIFFCFFAFCWFLGLNCSFGFTTMSDGTPLTSDVYSVHMHDSIGVNSIVATSNLIVIVVLSNFVIVASDSVKV